MCALGRGYVGARTDTTQHNTTVWTDKELDISHITVYVSGNTETDKTGMLSPNNGRLSGANKVGLFRADIGQIPAAVCVGFECCCNGQNVSDRTCWRYAASLGPWRQKLP